MSCGAYLIFNGYLLRPDERIDAHGQINLRVKALRRSVKIARKYLMK